MGKKNVTFVMSDEQNRNVEIAAAYEGKQKSEIVNEALDSYFADQPYTSILANHQKKKKSKEISESAFAAS